MLFLVGVLFAAALLFVGEKILLGQTLLADIHVEDQVSALPMSLKNLLL